MRLSTDNRLVVSPSDLSGYLACRHLIQLDVQVVLGELSAPRREDPQGELARRLGEEHEQFYLDQLHADGREIVEIEIEPDWDWERAARETEEALRAGADVIYQACFVDGDWRGFADFVERQPDGSYEAVDTKLARHGKPAHVLQLCFYSEQIGRITGSPARADARRARLGRARDLPRRRLPRLLPPRARPVPRPPSTIVPRPSRSRAATATAATSSSSATSGGTIATTSIRVAGMRRDQIARLAGVGIATLEQLGIAPAHHDRPTDGRRRPSRSCGAKRRSSSRHRKTGSHEFELLPLEAERGFGLLPKPSPGDLFFDIEGDPFWEPDRGLEYLFGVTEVTDGEPHFTALWAHDRAGEKSMLRAIHRPCARTPARVPRPARLPLRVVRADRAEAARFGLRRARRGA